MLKFMAIDYGDARTGVAFSAGPIVGDTLVLHESNRQRLISACSDLAICHGISKIAVGYPLNMNGSAGQRAQLCAAFARDLQKKSNIPCILWDERRTTVDAHRILDDNNKHGKKRLALIDAVAAALILEGFLAAQQNCC